MICPWKSLPGSLLLALAVAVPVGAQTPTATTEPSTPLLTLGTPALRASLDRLSLSWLYPAQIPDVRLKVDRPTLEQISSKETDTRLRGVEFRLPLEGFWVGYETQADGEEPRATLSIQRGF